MKTIIVLCTRRFIITGTLGFYCTAFEETDSK